MKRVVIQLTNGETHVFAPEDCEGFEFSWCKEGFNVLNPCPRYVEGLSEEQSREYVAYPRDKIISVQIGETVTPRIYRPTVLSEDEG